MSKINVNTVDTQCGSTLTLGSSGKTVTLASGASQSGFGRTGTVDWCTTAKTSPFTAVSGDGFFVNTTSGGITVTLPSSPSAGDIVSFADYANTWNCNAVTVCRNGSKINGGCFNAELNTAGQSVTLVYVDGTRGWKNTQDSTSNVSGVPTFISATGGTITTCGNDKIHTFTGDGTFTINSAPTPANNNVSYMVIAGGGGGGKSRAGGGGAGGFREGKTPATPYTASPLVAPAGLPVSVQGYPVTVGAGGAGSAICSANGASGVNSTFSSITSAGGGGGGSNAPAPGSGLNGGSGGGGMSPGPSPQPAGSGNTPPVSPPQGNPGGTGVFGSPHYGAGAGGGATAAGGNGTTSIGGTGGAGATTCISGSPVGRAGGGGGGGNSGTSGPATDGGGAGGSPAVTTGTGTANTGGGGGGGNGSAPNPSNATADGGTGGSGLVIIRYKFQ